MTTKKKLDLPGNSSTKPPITNFTMARRDYRRSHKKSHGRNYPRPITYLGLNEANNLFYNLLINSMITL